MRLRSDASVACLLLEWGEKAGGRQQFAAIAAA
jgi:hypothetical protein